MPPHIWGGNTRTLQGYPGQGDTAELLSGKNQEHIDCSIEEHGQIRGIIPGNGNVDGPRKPLPCWFCWWLVCRDHVVGWEGAGVQIRWRHYWGWPVRTRSQFTLDYRIHSNKSGHSCSGSSPTLGTPLDQSRRHSGTHLWLPLART